MVNFQNGIMTGGRCHAVILAIVCCVFLSHGKTDLPVFLLSGQSNMTGYSALVSDLTADQKKTVDNVMIYMDADGDAAKKKKWLTLGPGFGATSSNLGPELSFGRTLSDSMPGKKIAFIKDAVGGTYLSKTNGWLPPSSNNGTGGTLYKNMMTAIDAAMKSIGSAFDSTQYTPRWAGFVWLQGENDALDQTSANAYEKNLTNLIKDIRAKVNVADLPVILPLIAVQSIWPYNSTVRAADVTVKQKLPNIDTLDTKEFPSDGIHFKAAGYWKIGVLAAQRWLTMHYNYGQVVPVAHPFYQPAIPKCDQASPLTCGILFDVSGRKIGSFDGGVLQNLSSQSWSGKGVFIFQFNQSGKSGNSFSKKMLNIGRK
jgi:lysophospholipase L1-like esterase